MMNKSELDKFISQHSYITPLRYVSGRIVEYDIKSANITMLRKYHMIDDNCYNYLRNLPKINREIEVGLMIRENPKFLEVINNGIIEAKKQLFYKNKINPDSVIRIANDAVYINSSLDLPYTTFDDVIFKIKSVSSAIMKINRLLFLYWYSNQNININVIGLGKSQELHSNYMIGFIAQVINYIEIVSIKDALSFVTQFIDDYINLKLDKHFYRELTPESLYKCKNSSFYMSDIDNLNDIDIGYNFYLLREIYSIVLEKYNIQIRR